MSTLNCMILIFFIIYSGNGQDALVARGES